MRWFILIVALLLIFSACKKEKAGRVDIYMLSSFTTTTCQVNGQNVVSISNPVLADTAFIKDEDILSYSKSSTSFKINKNISAITQNYSWNHGFAVTVDGNPIYYGRFHPMFLSQLTVGVATINPMITNNEVVMDFFLINGVSLPDPRNDKRIIDAMKNSGRLQ